MKHDSHSRSHCSKLFDQFYFTEKKLQYFGLVFERLGKSLYEFIKDNKYRGINKKISFITL